MTNQQDQQPDEQDRDYEVVAEQAVEAFNADVGRNVAELRKAFNMTQGRLAERVASLGLVNFRQQTIQRIESGERPLKLQETMLIASVLNVAASDILKGTMAISDRIRLRDATRMTWKAEGDIGRAVEHHHRLQESLQRIYDGVGPDVHRQTREDAQLALAADPEDVVKSALRYIQSDDNVLGNRKAESE